MDEFIKQELNDITTAAESIICRVRGICGYCNGMETAASRYESPPNSIPIAQFNHSNGFGNQKSLVEVIKEMIIELKIKGSIRERANGLIELRTQAFGSIYGRTKEEIEAKLTERLKEAKKQSKKQKEQFSVPTNFDKFAVYWFENFHKRKVKDNTFKHNVWVYEKYIKNELLEFQINKITPVALQSMLDNCGDRGRTRENISSILNQIFTSAIKHGILKVNPLAMCFVEKHIREHGKAISKKDEKLLLAAYANTHYQSCFAIILYTGLRPNEYPTVEIEENFIKAVNSKQKGKNKKIEYKRIPITPMLRPYIKNFFKMLSPQVMDDKLKEVLPNHKLYDMRTTFQTRCTECGISDVAIGLFMGNSIGGALKQAYTDISDEYLLKEGKKLDY